MPIRFRCAYCNQLLGIARRKAGTVVRCPTCAGQVVVPNVDVEEGAKGSADNPPLFERSDFDDLFLNPATGKGTEPRTGGAAAGTATAPPAGAWGTHADPDAALEEEQLDVPRGAAAGVARLGHPPGLLLSPTRATLLTVLAIIALAVAFAAGVLVGWSFRP
jgi:phage FluMu protein Com